MTHFDRLKFSFNREVESELAERRTFYAKLFRNTDQTISLKAQLGTPIHYKEETLNSESPFLDIDLTPEVFSDRWEFNNGLYRLTVADSGEITYTSRAFGELTWRPVQIGNSANLNPSSIFHETRGIRDFIVFEDIRPGVDMLIRVGSAKVEPLFRVKTAQAPREFLWEIDQSEDAFFKVGEGGKGWDAGNGKRREIDLAKTDGAPEIGNGRRKVRSEEVWSGDVFERDENRQKVRKSDPKYPVLVDPPDVSEAISAGVDDVCSGLSGSAPYFNSTGNFINFFNTSPATYVGGGFRFRSLAIPNAQSIETALLKVAIFGVDVGGAIKFYGDDVDDAALWSASDGPLGITKTGASAPVSIPGTISAVPDVTAAVTAIVQEIVSRTGWASGNDMRFGVFPVGSVLANAVAYEKTSSPIGNGPARLEITFAAGGGGGIVGDIFKSNIFGGVVN